MSQLIVFASLGLTAGAIYAALSLGLVITYKGTGIINFAAGAMAAWGTYAFAEVHSSGWLVLPVPFNPQGHVGGGSVDVVGAVALAVVSAAMLVALAWFLAVRPVLRRRPSLRPVLLGAAAIGTVAWFAIVFSALRDDGRFLLPMVPDRIHLGTGSVATAILLGLVSAVAIGFLVHLLVFRPLRSAPPLAKVVASVGVMVTIDALVLLRFGTDARVIEHILPSTPISIGGVSMTTDRLYLGAAAVILGIAVWAFFRFSTAGIALRAGAENERSVMLAGYSPNRLAGGAWIVSTVVATFLCILAAPLTGLVPQVLTLMIVPALACALVGRFDMVGITVAAALGLGILQSELVYLTTQSWWPKWAVNGLSDAIPFVILIVVLFIVGRRLPARGAVDAERLPPVVIPRLRPELVAACAALGILALVLTSGGYRYGVITSMIIAIAALSFVVVTGMVGQISLAQAAIAGSAGFILSKLAESGGIPFPWSPLLSIACATLVGVLVGVPALRIRGAQLAVVTLAGAVAVEKFVFQNGSFTDPGGNAIPDAHVFGLNLAVSSGDNVARLAFGFFVLIVLLAAVLVVGNLMRSGTGRRLLAVRENERAAASVGVNVETSKLYAFGVASALAGIAGCLLAYSRQQLSGESFDVFVSLTWLAFAYLGGITSVGGAMLAGTFAPLGITYVLLDRWLNLGTDYTLIAGIGLVVTAVLNPVGIAGATRATFAGLATRFGWKGSEAEPPPAPPRAAVSQAPLVPRSDPPRREAANVVLETAAVSIAYGGIQAVDDLSLTIHRGEIVGLIGPNGAGKTSFIDGITGFTTASGQVMLEGAELGGLAAYERARRGLRRTWQAVEPFADLSVRENLQVAAAPAGRGAALLDLLHPGRRNGADDVDWALEQLGLTACADRKPSELSLGHQKLLGVARALAARPEAVLLDEPAAGLDSGESVGFGRHLETIADNGTAVLLIDHDMSLVLGVCDYVYVLEFGKLIAAGTPGEVRRDPLVMEAYLGGADGDEAAVMPDRTAPAGSKR